MAWFCFSFNELSTTDFHDIIHLRNAVFVVEQQCIFQDLDGKDKVAYHLFFKQKNKIVAYARLFKPGDYYHEAAIGRIVVEQSSRKHQLGRALLARSMKEIERLFGKVPIKIGAQTYLREFYESFQFFQVGEPYLEDGIPHMYMLNKSLV